MMKLDRFAPPGYNWRRELKWICVGLFFSVLYSISFFTNYHNFADTLYRWDGNVKTLYVGAVMADFYTVVDDCFVFFPTVALCLIMVILLHYAYHYQGAKSIYLMRRLPSRWELHIRCVAIPLAAMLASLLIAAILLLIYYGLYIAMTPKVCLTPHQWAKLWNAWIGV